MMIELVIAALYLAWRFYDMWAPRLRVPGLGWVAASWRDDVLYSERYGRGRYRFLDMWTTFRMPGAS